MEIGSHSIVWILAGLVFSTLLIFFNAFFVASEFAIVKVRRTRLEELVGQGVKRARDSLICVDRLDEYLSATQLGITLVSLALGWIGERTFAELLVYLFPSVFGDGDYHHPVALGISFFVITMLHIVIGELVPKSMAIQQAEKVSLVIAKPLRLFYSITRPLIRAFTSIANSILRSLGYGTFNETPLSESELKLVMKESKEDGVISESEAQIITRVFEFSDRKAHEIMVAEKNVDYICLNRPLDQNLAVVRKNMHTRFPVCHTDDLNSVIGIVHMKDVWPVLLTNFSNSAFESLVRPTLWVDWHMPQDQLLKKFQRTRWHMAMVRGKDGKVSGIVTMEDVLEFIVGEIIDEHGN